MSVKVRSLAAGALFPLDQQGQSLRRQRTRIVILCWRDAWRPGLPCIESLDEFAGQTTRFWQEIVKRRGLGTKKLCSICGLYA